MLCVVPFPLFYWAEHYLGSGMASIGGTLVYLRRYVAPLGLPAISVAFGQGASVPPSCWRPS
ncbi:hypothetical protein [Streptomyces albidoflavus]|uniref:hypothetical protein n=1 Tax=Streptomyces albidoflavus TaxID=1886 RepID=UPI0034112A5B